MTTLHIMWAGSPQPDWVRFNIASWRTHNPDWEIRVWDEAMLSDYIQMTRRPWDDMAQYIHPDGIWQGRSDLFRYEVLYREGGVYADADFHCEKSLDPLLVDGWTAWEIDGSWANMAISGFTPEHPFLAACLRRLEKHMLPYKRHKARGSSALSGPRYLTPILKDFPDVKIYPSAWFYPYGYNELDRNAEHFPEAYAVHHWNHMRTMAR